MYSWLAEVRPDFEPFVGMFGKDARRERPKVFAVLDPAIEDGPRIGPAGIGKQRPVAERARSELHAALKPADDIAVGDHVGGVAGGVLASPRRETGRLDGSQNLSLVELRTEIGRRAAWRRPRTSFGTMNRKSRADRGARVMRRGRDEDIREGARLPDQRIGDAIERDASGNAQTLEPDGALETSQESDDGRIGGGLQRGRNIHVPRKNLRFWFPRRPEQGLEPLRIEGRKAERAGIHRIVVLAHPDDRRELSPIYVGIAVGCEAHDLGGIVGRKAEMNARLLPHEPERVRIRERLDGFDPRAARRARASSRQPRRCRR